MSGLSASFPALGRCHTFFVTPVGEDGLPLRFRTGKRLTLGCLDVTSSSQQPPEGLET